MALIWLFAAPNSYNPILSITTRDISDIFLVFYGLVVAFPGIYYPGDAETYRFSGSRRRRMGSGRRRMGSGRLGAGPHNNCISHTPDRTISAGRNIVNELANAYNAYVRRELFEINHWCFLKSYRADRPAPVSATTVDFG